MRSLTVRMRALGRSPMRDMRPAAASALRASAPKEAGHYVLRVSDIALTLPQRSVTVMEIRPAAHLSQPNLTSCGPAPSRAGARRGSGCGMRLMKD
jgi:hypothetical protein